MTNDDIKELALANGFKLKPQTDGTEDLNPYVYQFARALMVKATEHTLGNVAELVRYIADFGPDTDPKVIDSEVYEIRHRMSGEYYEPDGAADGALFMGCKTQEEANFLARQMLDRFVSEN